MRLRGAGARARLLLALLLLTASCVFSPVPPGGSPATSPRAAVAKADRHHARQDRGAAKHRTGNDRQQRSSGKRARSSLATNQSNRGTGRQLTAQDSNPLDAETIAAANADDVT